MRVLVTGGTGVVGEAAVRALRQRGHAVRLLSRHAHDDARVWPDGVEARDADVTDAASLAGAADGCDAVLHVVGIVDEHPPDVTFARVNVEGTRHVCAEAARAGVPQLVYVSSLGAEHGASPYHRSKHAGEEIVRGFAGRWVIVRPGNVYGPGDEMISLLLRMVRALPAVPVLGGGDQPFDPVWADDVGAALAAACERADLAGRTLDVAGIDRTCMNDLLDRMERLTGRAPARVPLPKLVAGLGAKLASFVGAGLPINDGQLTMLAEGNVIARDGDNAIVHVLGVTPTPLDEGLRRLADALPEQLPHEGVGALHRKRFWADIVGARTSPEALFGHVCRRFQELTPDRMDLEAEPGTPTAVLHAGETVTMGLPFRGHVQVRVAELGPTSLTLLTLAGHPLAGAVRFTLAPRDEAPRDGATLRFSVEVLDRAAGFVDWLVMHAGGHRLQDATWREIVERVVRESGGSAPDDVQTSSETLEGDEARAAERWVEELAMAVKREGNGERDGK